jgi:hypothetical protein
MDLKGLVILVLAAVVLYLLFAPKMSGYAPASPAGFSAMAPAVAAAPAATDYSTGVVSSAGLIPREVVATEDFGQFSPDKIMSGQNYLDPRSQIGYPETIGGVLRNANLQIRSEPVNPREPVSIFNLSTIPPDSMRPKFEISPEYQ